MEISQWLALVSICLLGAMSPGPSLAVVLGCVVREGRAGGLRAAVAHGVAVALYGLLTVGGLALIITQTPSLYTALQLAGAAYLFFLGWRALTSKAQASPENTASAAQSGSAELQGFLVAFLNPKLAVFMLALFSQFLEPTFGLQEKALMVATVGATDALWYCLVALLLSTAGFQETLIRRAAAIERVFGVILIALAATVVAAALLN